MGRVVTWFRFMVTTYIGTWKGRIEQEGHKNI